MERPSTSKPRGVCRFFRSPQGCREQTRCRFLHDHPTMTPYDLNKTCKFYVAGFCSKGDTCWFKHTVPVHEVGVEAVGASGTSSDAPVPAQEVAVREVEPCSICYEDPVTFGLLTGCNHAFCIKCLRDWRDPKGKSEDLVSSRSIKKCPLCREPSRYIVPSSHFYGHGTFEKAKAIDTYRASMARVPCKYFKPTHRNPTCPFADDCFYQHLGPDGRPHVFGYGVDDTETRRRARRRYVAMPRIPNLQDLLHFEVPTIGIDIEADIGHSLDFVDRANAILHMFQANPSAFTNPRTASRRLQDVTNHLTSLLRHAEHSRNVGEEERGGSDDGNISDIAPSDSASQVAARLANRDDASNVASAGVGNSFDRDEEEDELPRPHFTATHSESVAGPGPAGANSEDRMHLVWNMVSDRPMPLFPELLADMLNTPSDFGPTLEHNPRGSTPPDFDGSGDHRSGRRALDVALADVGGTPAGAHASSPSVPSSRFSTTVLGRTPHTIPAEHGDDLSHGIAPLEPRTSGPWFAPHAPTRITTVPAPGPFLTAIHDDGQRVHFSPFDTLSPAPATLDAHPRHAPQDTSSSNRTALSSISMSDAALLDEASQTVRDADELADRTSAMLQSQSAEFIPGAPSSPQITGDAEEQTEERNEHMPSHRAGPYTVPSVTALAGAPVEDEWDNQEVPAPPFKTDGRGKVVFADPSAAIEYGTRRRSGRS